MTSTNIRPISRKTYVGRMRQNVQLIYDLVRWRRVFLSDSSCARLEDQRTRQDCTVRRRVRRPKAFQLELENNHEDELEVHPEYTRLLLRSWKAFCPRLALATYMYRFSERKLRTLSEHKKKVATKDANLANPPPSAAREGWRRCRCHGPPDLAWKVAGGSSEIWRGVVPPSADPGRAAAV